MCIACKNIIVSYSRHEAVVRAEWDSGGEAPGMLFRTTRKRMIDEICDIHCM